MTPFRLVFGFLVLALSCLATIPFLSINFIPDSIPNSFTIHYDFPGRPPLIVEQEIGRTLENTFSTLNQLEKIYAVTEYGSGYVELSFAAGTDMEFREMEIYALLRRITSQLSEGVGNFRVLRSTADAAQKKPLLIYEFLHPESESIAANQWLKSSLLPAFNTFVGLEKTELAGQRDYAWHITFDPEILRALELSPAQIKERLRTAFKRRELGLSRNNNLIIPVFYDRKFSTSSDLKKLHISKDVTLGMLADISLREDRVRQYKRINGKSAVFVSLFPRDQTNRLELARMIKERLADPGSFVSLPAGYELRLNYDDSEFLHRELNKTLLRAGLSIGILLLLIFAVSRNLRYLTVLMSSIFVSYCLSIGLAWAFQIEIHLYTLAAATIAIGIIIDNSIVLLDHYRRYHNIDILGAQLAASITTIASLLVIFLLPKAHRTGLDEFAWMIALALLVSFFVAWWFTPSLAALLKIDKDIKHTGHLKKHPIYSLYRSLILFVARFRSAVWIVLILSFGLPVYLLPGHVEGWKLYNQSIGSDHYRDELRSGVNKLLGGTSRLFYQYVYEGSTYRTPQKTRLFVNAALPYGHTLQQMDQTIRQVENYLKPIAEIDKFITQVYSGQYASITIEFKTAYEKGGFPYILKGRLVSRSIDWGGVNWSVYGVGQGFSNASMASLPSFYLQAKGYNYDDLALQADNIAAKLLAHPRIQKVNTNSQLSWNQSSFETFHFEPAPVLQAARLKDAQTDLLLRSEQLTPALYLAYNERYFPVYISSVSAPAFSLYDAMNQTGQNQPGLVAMGRVERRSNPDAIHKEDRQYIRGIRYDYVGSYKFGKLYLDSIMQEVKKELPAGYTVELKERTWSFGEKSEHSMLVPVLLLLLFFVISIHLESLKDAFFVTLTVPLSYIGIFIAFGWMDFSFDQGGYAAFLMTSGLSVNAILYLISDIRSLEKRLPNETAIVEAVRAKARPVLLTILSTCLGLIPFLIHGPEEVFWFSFAVGTIAGLLFSLILFFLVVPLWFIKKVQKI